MIEELKYAIEQAKRPISLEGEFKVTSTTWIMQDVSAHGITLDLSEFPMEDLPAIHLGAGVTLDISNCTIVPPSGWSGKFEDAFAKVN